MIEFEINKKYPSFKFSSKTEVITLPATFLELSDEEKEFIKDVLIKSRELYMSKLNQYKQSKNIGILQARAEAIQEILQDCSEEQINNIWFKFHPRKNKVTLNKPVVRNNTLLDNIENNPYSYLDSEK